ncbi:hypothetical protein AGR1A_pAt10059 [Agrobacterium fabacearum CFBP 5771]|nr:hypothetical protein AGR1A_pAt10059 [Agrobacterium fabacearum CFBP 5771]
MPRRSGPRSRTPLVSFASLPVQMQSNWHALLVLSDLWAVDRAAEEPLLCRLTPLWV